MAISSKEPTEGFCGVTGYVKESQPLVNINIRECMNEFVVETYGDNLGDVKTWIAPDWRGVTERVERLIAG